MQNQIVPRVLRLSRVHINPRTEFGQNALKITHVTNTFRTWKRPPKYCIELEADWLIILDEVRKKSPGRGKVDLLYQKYVNRQALMIWGKTENISLFPLNIPEFEAFIHFKP